MYHATHARPAPLADADYLADSAAADADVLRDATWQLVAATSMLSRPGDVVGTNRLGVPLMIRNEGGRLIALGNVCAHRHCLIADEGPGHHDEIKCPYHGWRYGADGRTRKLPGAKHFPGFDRESHRLPAYDVATVGGLLLVNLSKSPDPFVGGPFVGGRWWDVLAERTAAPAWRFVMHDRLDYACDWKIPIEGSLESYHLGEVHADTFGEDPGEEATEHDLFPGGTSMSTRVRESSFLARLEERVVAAMTGSFDPTYRHVHLFPNVMASLTDTMTLVYQIFPRTDAPEPACRLEVFGFTRAAERLGPAGRVLSRGLGWAAVGLARRVLAEDATIFTRVQSGMNAAEAAGCGPRLFGRCEERLTAFQEHWQATRKEWTP